MRDVRARGASQSDRKKQRRVQRSNSQIMVHSAQRMFVRLIHLKNSGFIILSGDVVHLEENFEKNRVPSLNTDKVELIASMEKIRQMIAAYRATLFINQDKKQTDRV